MCGTSWRWGAIDPGKDGGMITAMKAKGAARQAKTAILIALYLLFVSILATSLFATSTSFLYPATNLDFVSVDSNFFLYEGYLLVMGETPYLDFFDHKGLYHVLINALAVLFGGRHALFAIEIAFLFVTLLFLFLAIGEMDLHPVAPYFATALYAALLLLMGSGNSEAEYLMPFIAGAQWAFIKGIKYQKNSYIHLAALLAGMEAGLSLNSRPTDIMWAGALAIAYLAYYFRNERNLELLFNALFGLLGLTVAVVPFVLYAHLGGFLSEMIDAVYLMSSSYLMTSLDSLGRVLNTIILVLVSCLFLIIGIYLRRKSSIRREFLEAHLIALSTALVCYFIIARFTTYYWTSFTYLSAFLTMFLFSFRLKNGKKKGLYLLIPSLFTLVWSTSVLTIYYGPGFWDFSYKKSQAAALTIRSLPEEAKEKGSILAIDCNAGVYLLAGVETDFPYFVNQTWWSESRPEVATLTAAYLKGEEAPEYLLAAKDGISEIIEEAIATNYQPLETVPENELFDVYVRM